MHNEPTTAEKLRLLPWSLAGNAANAVYAQLTFFGSVFILFLSQLGLSKATIGTLLSLIPFFCLVSLFVAPAVTRVGYKRVFAICFGIRTFVTLGLLFTPWVLVHFGPDGLLWTVVTVISMFSVFRAIGMTAGNPWTQEYVPAAVRGKYVALSEILVGSTGFLAITAAGAFLGRNPDLRDYGLLFAVGIIAELVCIWAYTHVPGGAPQTGSHVDSASPLNLVRAAANPDLFNYLVGAGLVVLASAGLGSFVFLFMREAVGLNPGQVVRLQGATLVGGLLTSYVWGWAADRYGSRPVALLGLYAKAVLPIFWFLMPRGSAWTLPIAFGTAAWQGFANMGWAVGSTRLLYADVVPLEKSASYMTVYFASFSIIEGLSQLLSGRLLDSTAGLHGRWLGLTIDAYSLLFAAGVVLPLLGSLALRRVHAHGSVTATGLAGMFVRGKPWLAARSLIGYKFARDESATVLATERLGRAKSPLTVEELLKSLTDPRFNVRFEAVVAIAHRRADPRLTEALVQSLHGHDPALSTLAAWALGRCGDRNAIPALRLGLQARYRSVQAPCARSLATLGDFESGLDILQRLVEETDEGLQIAYAAALGILRYQPATRTLQDLLWRQPQQEIRMEVALALARMVGEERFFVQLMRQMNAGAGTALSRAVTALGKRLHSRMPGSEGAERLVRCAEAFARDQMELGAAMLAEVLQELLPTATAFPISEVLQACVIGMRASGAKRIEYLILALHTLNALVEEH